MAVRYAYRYNPACVCGHCANGGTNPAAGSPASQGYGNPHIPLLGPREVVDDAHARHYNPWLRQQPTAQAA